MLRRTVAVGLVAAIGFVLTLPAQPAAGKRYALVVGVNKYDKPGFPELNYAQRDAEELAKVLTASGYEVKLLLGSADADARATKPNIEAAMERLLEATTQDDTFLIAMAGHGLQFTPEGETTEQAYFCPRDAVDREPKKLINLSRLLSELNKRGAGTNLLLIDACRNDTDANRGVRSLDGGRVELRPGTVGMLSCSRGQVAFENDALRHGIFFHFVLEGLRGKAANARGEVSWDLLKEYVRTEMSEQFPKLVTASGRTQKPQDFGNLTERVVVAKAAPRAALPPTPPGLVEPKADREIAFELMTGVKLTLARIPTGKFWMGSPSGETGHSDDEDQHEVEITRDFYMGIHEVTQEQYEAVTGGNPSNFKGPKLPVEQVSWDDTQTFLTRLNEKLRDRGYLFRLPTEAEWEYSCRGGATSQDSKPFHFEDGPTSILSTDRVNFDGNYPYGTTTKGEFRQKTTPAGHFKPNKFGLYDMHGNVWEWCQDYYGPYSKLKTTKDPIQEDKVDEDRRVVRGGSWLTNGHGCRAADRGRDAPAFRDRYIGFRVVGVPRPR